MWDVCLCIWIHNKQKAQAETWVHPYWRTRICDLMCLHVPMSVYILCYLCMNVQWLWLNWSYPKTLKVVTRQPFLVLTSKPITWFVMSVRKACFHMFVLHISYPTFFPRPFFLAWLRSYGLSYWSSIFTLIIMHIIYVKSQDHFGENTYSRWLKECLYLY